MNRRRRPPRQFQYLDTALTESYLSDLVGGLPEGGSSTGRSTDSEQKDWGLRYWGTGIGGTTGTEGASEDQENFRYTPEAIFRRLHDELDRETDEGKILVHLDSLNKDSWGELLDGDIVQITGKRQKESGRRRALHWLPGGDAHSHRHLSLERLAQ